MSNIDTFLQNRGLAADHLSILSDALEALDKLVHTHGVVIEGTVKLLMADDTGVQHAVPVVWSEDHSGYVALFQAA